MVPGSRNASPMITGHYYFQSCSMKVVAYCVKCGAVDTPRIGVSELLPVELKGSTRVMSSDPSYHASLPSTDTLIVPGQYASPQCLSLHWRCS